MTRKNKSGSRLIPRRHIALFLIVLVLMIYPVLYTVDTAMWPALPVIDETDADAYFHQQFSMINAALTASGAQVSTPSRSCDELQLRWETTASFENAVGLNIVFSCSPGISSPTFRDSYWTFTWQTPPGGADPLELQQYTSVYSVISALGDGVISAKRIEKTAIQMQKKAYAAKDRKNVNLGFAERELRAYVRPRLYACDSVDFESTEYTEQLSVRLSFTGRTHA